MPSPIPISTDSSAQKRGGASRPFHSFLPQHQINPRKPSQNNLKNHTCALPPLAPPSLRPFFFLLRYALLRDVARDDQACCDPDSCIELGTSARLELVDRR
jgi:hypothetical protein